MVKYLVDTHALIWFIEGNPKLGIKAREILEDIESQLSKWHLISQKCFREVEVLPYMSCKKIII